MINKNILKSLSLSVIFVGTAAAKESKPVPSIPDKPNIILIISDDAGYTDFGFMESKACRTPHLDKLAARGIVFEQAYAGPTCSPSRCGILSGQYAQRHGFGRNCGARLKEPNDGFPKGVATLPMYLKQLGYNTGLIGKWHQGAAKGVNQPLDLGFDEFWGVISGHRNYFGVEKGVRGMWRNRTHDRGWVKRKSDLPPDPKKGRYVTDAMGDEAMEMVERFSKKEAPFYLCLSFTSPHTPFQAKEQDLALFPKLKGNRKVTAAMQFAMDRACGRLFERLDALGLTEKTHIFFLNDNGGYKGNTPKNGHLRGFKGCVYEGGVRVPMVISGPGIATNQHFEPPVVHRDILPTMVALAGGTPPQGLDGVNLIPYLDKSNTGKPHEQLVHRHVSAGVAIRRGDWKLINPRNPGEHGKSDPGIWELYDLAKDPSETKDIADKHPDRVQELKAELAVWEADMTKNRWGKFGKQDRNYFDSFTYRSDKATTWFGKDAWHNTASPKDSATMSCQDLYPNAELVFPLSPKGYTSKNDLYSASGLKAMLNILTFTGEGSARLSGNPIRFVASLRKKNPLIQLPENARVSLELPVHSSAPLTIKGGSLTFTNQLVSPKVEAHGSNLVLGPKSTIDDLKLYSGSLTLKQPLTITGTLSLADNPTLKVSTSGAIDAKHQLLRAKAIVGQFANKTVELDGKTYTIQLEKNALYVTRN